MTIPAGYRHPLDPDHERLDAARKKAAVVRQLLDGQAWNELPERSRTRIAELDAALAAQAAADRGKLDGATLDDFEDEVRNASDLAAQYEAQLLRQEVFGHGWDPRGRVLRIFALVAGTAVASFALTLLPADLRESADKRSRECITELDQGKRSDPRECRERARLLWPSLVPWERAAALAERARIDAEVLRRDMVAATAGAADPGRRAAVAAEAAELPAKVQAEILAQAGAVDELAAAARVDGEAALYAAATVADFERVRLLASVPDDPNDAPLALRQGAWLCLLGDERAGLAKLRLADRIHLDTGGDPSGLLDARLAAVACGQREDDTTLDTRVVQPYGRATLRLLRLLDPAWQQGRRVAIAESILDDTLRNDRAARLPAAALWITARQPAADAALATISPARGHLLFARRETITSPYAVLRTKGAIDEPAVDPWWLESAAAQLEALVPSAPASLAIDPRALEGSDPETAGDPTYALRRAATVLWLESAAACTRYGLIERARTDLARAEAIAPEQLAWNAGALRLAIDDDAGAAALVEPLLAKLAPEEAESSASARAHEHAAWAAARLGKWEEALAHARTAHRATQAADAEENVRLATLLASYEPGDPTSSREGVRTAWFLAAMMLRAGKVEPIDGLPPSLDELTPYLQPDPLPLLATLLRMAALPEAERRRWRVALPALLPSPVLLDVLPAVVYVVGAAAPDGDVETWLDRAFARSLLATPATAGGLRLWTKARAEAAAWRGDASAAARWRERFVRLQGLVKEPRSAMLATIGGL